MNHLYQLKENVLKLRKQSDAKLDELKKFMKRFDELLVGNPYTDAKEFNDSGYYNGIHYCVNIYYSPDSGIHIATQRIVGSYFKVDENPDVEIIEFAFRKHLQLMLHNELSTIENVDHGIEILSKIPSF